MNVDFRLPLTFGIAGSVAVGLPILLMLWVRRRLQVAWKVFALGAAAFVVSQVMIRIPLVVLLQWLLGPKLKEPVAQVAWLIGLSVTAGLFEETARYLVYRKLLKGKTTWSNAVGLGVGHGGIESILLVGLGMLANVAAIYWLAGLDLAGMEDQTRAASLQQARAVFEGMQWWMPLLGGWERVCAIALHISLSVMVLQAVVRQRARWFWGAVGYHALVNGAAVFAMRAWGAVAAEALLTVFLLFSVWLVFRLRPARDQEEVMG